MKVEEATGSTNPTGYGKKPIWQWIVLYALIGGVVYAVIYFGLMKKGGYSYAPTAQIQTAPAANTTTTGSGIIISGSEFAFTPASITTKVGQPVTLTFKNEGKYPHNLSISDLNVQTKTINPGESDSVTFTPDKTGSFTYICTVPGHADKGMKGTLTVE